MNKAQALFIAISLALILLSPLAMAQIATQYMVLASFDFLSADEVAQFNNITLSGQAWNSTLTSYAVSNGVLNISNSDTVDVFLAYPMSIEGYAEIKFGGDGAIGVFDPIAYNQSQLIGYELVRTSTGITIYAVNGTSSKTALTSISTTADTIIVTIMDGRIRFDLPDGTGVYETSGEGILALGAPAGGVGVFDKVVLYGRYLAGTYEVDLGTKTIEKGMHVVVFEYDVSQYTNIKSAKLIVQFNPATNDPWLRWVIILFEDNGQYYLPYEFTITNNHRWPSPPIPPEYVNKYTDITYQRDGPRTYDVTQWIQQHPKGKIYIGVQTAWTAWTASVKLVLDAEKDNTVETTTTTSSWKDKLSDIQLNNTAKYALLGLGAIIVLVLLFTLVFGKKRYRGLAPLLAIFLIFLILGGITAAVLAWLHPEYLVAMAFGLGAIAIIVLFLLITTGKRIPNPVKPT